jgi:glucose/arabinose dehydrogenase
MSNRDNPERHRIVLSVIALAAVAAASLLMLVAVVEPGEAATLQPGFGDELLTSVNKPTALAFTPDGRMLVTTQPGQLRVYKNGTLLQTPALTLGGKGCYNKERGLLGVAVDPDFSTNHYVYLFYTSKKHAVCPTGQFTSPDNPVNRVSRFTMAGDIVDPSSELVLVDNIPSPGNHNAGDLQFGKDGYLYISVGDGECDYIGDSGCNGANDASRDQHILLGKVLRITRDGAIPGSNPFTGPDSARCNVTGRTDVGKKCQETFAWGLRNPFRMAFDPNASDTRFFVNDVGQNVWEEVNQGRSGADYGWNLCEGAHDNPNRSGSVDCSAAPYTPPIHEYSHVTGCGSITGGAFVPDGLWPAEYDGSYLYGDYVCGKIFKLTPSGGGGFTQSEFVSGLGSSSAVAMTFGPHQGSQALYYTSYANGGEIHRITHTVADNRSPNAVVSADPTSGTLPLGVNFDGSASSDPDTGDSLSYVWDFGDGSPTETTSTPMTSHTYSTSGMYTATLTVRDTSGAEDAATVQIDAGNAAPAPTIVSPAQDELFSVGEKIMLQGSATDSEDGSLPDSSLSWEVFQHHNNSHTHPFLSSTTGNDVEITAPAPEDLAATDPAGNYLEIRLTATDSTGLSKTVTRILRPNAVSVTLDTRPTGLGLLVNGTNVTAPKPLTSWEGYKLTLEAPSPQTLAGTTYAFSSWSDGGARSHDIVTGTAPSTYTAIYTPTSVSCTINGTSGADTLSGTSGDDVICGGSGNDTIRGLGGNDILKGEIGTDTLLGAAGDDTYDGGPGGDAAEFPGSAVGVVASLVEGTATGEGSDTLINIEKLIGSPKDDTLTGSATANTLRGQGGVDTISGLEGNDGLLNGEGGTDTVRGGPGNDNVVGGGAADSLFGEEGDDTVNSKDGVSGNDSLDGGPHVNGDIKVTDTTEKAIVGFP